MARTPGKSHRSRLKSFLLLGMNEVNEMLGAIIGEIVGSVYELHYIKTKDCFFTDVTVMACVVAWAAMKGYGGGFKAWIAASVQAYSYLNEPLMDVLRISNDCQIEICRVACNNEPTNQSKSI